MRKSGVVIAALVGGPVLLVGSTAAALEITFDQVTATAGAAALGVVGGPLGGLAGSVIGRQIGRKIHPRPREIDISDLRSRTQVTPIRDDRVIDAGVGVPDRAVDFTPIRELELRPAEVEARTYLATARGAAPHRAAEARAYLAAGRHRVPRARTYLAAAQRPAPEPETAAVQAIPVSATVKAPPGTLDYQLNQLRAHQADEADAALVRKVADVR